MEAVMKLWIASSSVAFLLFVIFFARQFPKYNWLFASWLLLNVALQGTFALFAAAGKTRSIPDIPIDFIGWMLIGLAMIKAYRSTDAVNEIILYGLIAQVFLHAFSMSALHFYQPDNGARVLASNLACFSPLAYMLVRFTFVYSDRLPLISRLRDLGSATKVPEVLGYARALVS
jgi:hypothetical protein